MEIDISKIENGYLVQVYDDEVNKRYVFFDLASVMDFVKEKFSN